MSVEKLVVLFYCLDIPDAILLLFGCSVLFYGIHRRFAHRRIWRCLVTCMLIVLAAFIFKLTLGDRGEGSNFQINLIPFHSYREVRAGGNPEIYRSNFMNAALFYPAGFLSVFLLPKKWPGWCRCIAAVLALMAVSIVIEYLQYRYGLGKCEIDDVIHNTAGALAGCIVSLLFPWLLRFFKEHILRGGKFFST